MANIVPIRAPSGWKPWTYIPTATTAADKNGNNQEYFRMSFGIVPKTVLPSGRFQIWSPDGNCSITVPWSTATIAPIIGGIGQGGTLIGVIGGIGLIGGVLAEPSGVFYSISSNSGPGPIVGYCLGNAFSERVYVAVEAMKDPFFGDVIVIGIGQDVLQRYRVSRFILHHGQIETYYKNSNPAITEEYLSIGIDRLPSSVLGQTMSMTIYKKDGKTITTSIKGFLENGDAIVAPFTSTDQAPSSGDFYVMDNAYLIDDPYLMAGLWSGTETEVGLSVTSGFDLPLTSNQQLYTQGKFIGGYALFNHTIDNSKTPPTTTTTVAAGGAGQPMTDSISAEWRWWLRDPNDITSDSYADTENRPSISYSYDASTTDIISSPFDPSK